MTSGFFLDEIPRGPGQSPGSCLAERAALNAAQIDSFLKIRSGTSLMIVMITHQNPGV